MGPVFADFQMWLWLTFSYIFIAKKVWWWISSLRQPFWLGTANLSEMHWYLFVMHNNLLICWGFPMHCTRNLQFISGNGIFFMQFLPPSWRHAHAHFGFAHRQQPLRWLKPFLKHWYVKLYELVAPHTLKWINSVIKLGHFVWNSIYCLSRIKFKDRWVVFFIYDSFCWTKSPTAAGLGSRNDAM